MNSDQISAAPVDEMQHAAMAIENLKKHYDQMLKLN